MHNKSLGWPKRIYFKKQIFCVASTIFFKISPVQALVDTEVYLCQDFLAQTLILEISWRFCCSFQLGDCLWCGAQGVSWRN